MSSSTWLSVSVSLRSLFTAYFIRIRAWSEIFSASGDRGVRQRGRETHQRCTAAAPKVSREVFNLCYETTLIFSERAVHKMFIFQGWIRKLGWGGGREGHIFWGVVTNVTWVWHEFGKKDASASQATDAGAAMATGLWIKAMWLIMGWLTHNARPVLLHKLPLNECVLIKRTYLHSTTVQGTAMTAARRLHLGAHDFLPARARAHMLYINTHFSAQ